MSISKMQDDADEFSKTLDMKKFDAAKNAMVQLQKKHVDQAIVNYELVEKMRDGFKTFPQLKANDQVQEQLEYLQAAQDNLNANPTNTRLAVRLVQVAGEVADTLTTEYGDVWVNPYQK